MLRRDNIPQHKIVFFLVPNFSLIAFATAIEPLRLANRFLPKPSYQWCIVSGDGQPVTASNGLSVNVDGSLDELRTGRVKPIDPEMVLVCSGLGVEDYSNPHLNTWLRSMHKQKVTVGGLCTGAWVLAQAGLLDGKRCAIHWENLPTFAETFPEADVYADLFEQDGHVCSCAGGTASLDMMLVLIGEHFGEKLVTKVCEQALTDRARSPKDRQRMPLRSRLGIHNTKMLFIIEMMEANIAEPLTLRRFLNMSACRAVTSNESFGKISDGRRHAIILSCAWNGRAICCCNRICR